MNLRLTIVIAAAALAGCASAGVRVSEDQVAQLNRSNSTYADVVARLGQPTMTTLNSDGSRTAIYSYAETRIRPQTLIPFVGAFVGGADTHSNTVSFNFDREGKLVNHSSSAGDIGSGVGLAAGSR